MAGRKYKRGDLVVFCKFKRSACPGPRAKSIHPEPRGEDYAYDVNKFWVVAEAPDADTVVTQTRRGKRHVIEADSSRRRKATLWERLFYRSKFPTLSESEETRPRPK